MISARALAAQFVARCSECDGSGERVIGRVMAVTECHACKGSGRIMGIDAIAAAIEARDRLLLRTPVEKAMDDHHRYCERLTHPNSAHPCNCGFEK